MYFGRKHVETVSSSLIILSKPESVKLYQLINQCPALISLRNQ